MSAPRIDTSATDTRCWRTDHNVARLINYAREKAHAKHGADSIEAIPHDDPRWLAILVEEVGEVAHALTYDSGATPEDVADELVDVLAVAAAWLDAKRVAGIRPNTTGVWLAS